MQLSWRRARLCADSEARLNPGSRYALCFAPPVESPLWLAGSTWLGRDAARDEPAEQPVVDNILADTLHAITAMPRRYGFHATLKAPFHLSESTCPQELLEHVDAFAGDQHSFPMPQLVVSQLDQFLALVPALPAGRVNAMAKACVAEFDRHRKPLDEAELARRRRQRLTPREDEMLVRWGYPHVLDCFRFHFTLTDSLCGTHDRFIDGVRGAAERMFSMPASQAAAFDAISVFEETAPGGDFRLIHRAPFGRQGRLVYVVGASGVGKDSLLRWAKVRTQPQHGIVFAQRVITRPLDSGVEQHEPVTAAQFDVLRSTGELGMTWNAHGFSYGVRRPVLDELKYGMTVVVSGSRAHLPAALAHYPDLEVVHVTASDDRVAQRLRERGREDETAIATRQTREPLQCANGAKVLEISNEGEISIAGEALMKLLLRPR
jgi:phosphonate metabolism protein PhnN/1,5-bisphosphokinase (PRPP-forming)